MIYLGGAYRQHRSEDVARFTSLAEQAYPDFAGRIVCFGADWLGRQFATDSARQVNGFPQVLMLEPGTGECLEIPVDHAGFYNHELVEAADAAVAYSFDDGWNAAVLDRTTTSALDTSVLFTSVVRTTSQISNSATSTFTGPSALSCWIKCGGCRPAPGSALSPSDNWSQPIILVILDL